MENKQNLELVLKQLAHDDKTALQRLFNYFYPRLYNFSRTFLKLDEGIDDILQEVFIFGKTGGILKLPKLLMHIFLQ